jgi:hypothetical protein
MGANRISMNTSMGCKHPAQVRKYDPSGGYGYLCAVCNSPMPWGPASDTPEAMVELRAAVISLIFEEDGRWPGRLSERQGRQGFFTGDNPPGEDDGAAWHAGWLSAAMNIGCGQQLPSAYVGWPWDPSRPVAGQYDAWLTDQLKHRRTQMAVSAPAFDRQDKKG